MKWPQLMQFGFGILKLNSKDFWALSVPELEAAIAAHFPPQAEPLTSQEFASLQTAYPDEPQQKGA